MCVHACVHHHEKVLKSKKKKKEDDRVNQQHWLIREAFGSHFSAPVHDLLENGTKVHDAGCGSLRVQQLPDFKRLTHM